MNHIDQITAVKIQSNDASLATLGSYADELAATVIWRAWTVCRLGSTGSAR
jgi:hypothetical protein